jgi:hypothetical protein
MFGSVGRLKAGWLNSYREDEIRSMFTARRYVQLRDENWHNQRLYVFSRQR